MKKNQCCRQQPYKFSCLHLPTSYFCLQCLTRFDGFKSHFSNTKGSRQPITGKRNPRPKPSQLRMALHMPDSTRGVSHCLMEHCQIINLHEFTLQMNQSLTLFGVLQTKVTSLVPSVFTDNSILLLLHTHLQLHQPALLSY